MNQQRWGTSLIEVLVAVSISGVVLTTGIGLIHMILRVERTTQQSVSLGTAGSRLSRVFRQDLHRATLCRISSSEDGTSSRLELQLPHERAVTYEATGHRLTRAANAGGKPEHHDQFVFPIGCRIDLQASHSPDRTAVLIWQAENRMRGAAMPNRTDSQSPRDLLLRIQATLARDQRYGTDDAIQ